MSFKPLAKRALEAGSPTDHATASILSLDIERYWGEYEIEWRGCTVKGNFWSLNDTKKTIGFRLPYTAVTRWPRTVSVAGHWVGTDETFYYAEWQRGGAKAMARGIRDRINEADLLVGHNIDGFDLPHIRTLIDDHREQQFKPVKTRDTLKIARGLKYESCTLDALCQRFGIPTKVGKYDVENTRLAIEGDKEAQRKHFEYNVGDPIATSGLYLRFLPLDHKHPPIWPKAYDANGNLLEQCNRCGTSGRLFKRDGETLKVVLEHALYECKNCGGWSTAQSVRRAAKTRGAA